MHECYVLPVVLDSDVPELLNGETLQKTLHVEVCVPERWINALLHHIETTGPEERSESSKSCGLHLELARPGFLSSVLPRLVSA